MARTYHDRTLEVAERWGAPDAVAWSLSSNAYLDYVVGA
jgi:hypothetical protein